MNGDVITWDDDTLEVNIDGQDYPGSSIVDILSYLMDKNSNDLFYMTGDCHTTDRLMLGMPQNTIEVVKALNYLIPSGEYDVLFQKLGFDMKKAHRLGEIKRKKQISNTKLFNAKAKKYNKNDVEAEEERAKKTMRQSLGIMGELEDQYNRDMMMMMIMCKGLKGGKNLRMKNFLIPVMYCHLKRERERD